MYKTILLTALIASSGLCAQQADSIPKQALQHYLDFKQSAAAVFNGKEHVGYPNTISGNAYLDTDEWQQGSITYQSVHYPKVWLKYDVFKDEIIIKHPENNYAITLFSKWVNSFTLGNRKFVFTDQSAFPKAGFYEVLFTGKLTAYAKYNKIIEERNTSAKVEKFFTDKHAFFVLKNNIWISIRNDRDLFAVADNREDVKRYLQSNLIRFKDDPAYAIVKMAEYYNQLTP